MHDHFDVAGVRIADGYFLARGDRSGSPRFRVTDGRMVFTRPNQEASLRDTLYNVLDASERKLFVSSFLLDDPGVVDRLARKARQLRGSVYVVTALKDEWLGDTFGDQEEASPGPTKHLVEPLVQAGVQVRGCRDAHAKFVVADDREALVSTANFDVRGLIATGEAGVRISDPDEVLRLSRFFSRLWLSRCELEMPHDPSGRFTARSTKRPATVTAVPVAELSTPDRVLWTDGKEQLILDAFAATADSASRDLIVATYDTRGLETLQEQILSRLARAVQRGVRVQLLTRIRNPRRASRESLRRLTAVGVEVRGDSTNHAKFIIADRKAGALFSANLDAEHGLTSGIEVGAAVNGEDAAALAAYFDEAFDGFASAPFVDGPTHADMNQHLRARFRRPWETGRAVSVRCDRKTWENFRKAADAGHPMLFQENGDVLRLHVAVESFEVSTSEGSMKRSPRGKDHPAGRHSGELLDQWMSDRAEPSEARGIFAGTIRAEVVEPAPEVRVAAPTQANKR